MDFEGGGGGIPLKKLPRNFLNFFFQFIAKNRNDHKHVQKSIVKTERMTKYRKIRGLDYVVKNNIQKQW